MKKDAIQRQVLDEPEPEFFSVYCSLGKRWLVSEPESSTRSYLQKEANFGIESL